MQGIITSYLIQNKECGLPLLGSFVIKLRSAINDIPNKQIVPPVSDIVFSETGDYLHENLISYYSRIKKMPESEAEKELQSWCLQEKLRLDDGHKSFFYSIGSLQKENGKIVFHKEENITSFFEPVAALRIIHNDEHAILVGDRETTSTAMNEFYSDNSFIQKRFSWKNAALILFIISLLMLAFYFYDHSFSENSIGNQSSFPAANPASTYDVP